MTTTLNLGRIAGIRIGMNWSLLVVVALIAWSLATGFLPGEVPGLAAGWYWAAALVTAVVYLGSLLAHELAHSLVAQRVGVRVEGITLWLFGGVARLGGDAQSAGREVLITAVGPATSLVLGGLFLLLFVGLSASPLPALVAATALWLGIINLLLAVFNLIPAFPLDGGRILRALTWAATRSRLRATAIAVRVGMVFSFLMMAAGVVEFLLARDLVGGVWLVFLGWFLLSAGRAEETGTRFRQALGNLTVAQVMTPNPVMVPDYITLQDFLDRFVAVHRHPVFPTLDLEGRLTGLVSAGAIQRLDPASRAMMRVRDVACPLSQVPIASPQELAVGLLRRLAGCSDGRALVVWEGRLVGIVSPADLGRVAGSSPRPDPAPG